MNVLQFHHIFLKGSYEKFNGCELHSFCSSLIREYFSLLGLLTHFESSFALLYRHKFFEYMLFLTKQKVYDHVIRQFVLSADLNRFEILSFLRKTLEYGSEGLVKTSLTIIFFLVKSLNPQKIWNILSL